MGDLVERLEFASASNSPSLSFRYGKLIQSHQELCKEAAAEIELRDTVIAGMERDRKIHDAAAERLEAKNQRLREALQGFVDEIQRQLEQHPAWQRK